VLEDFITFIAQHLVDKPEDVRVVREEEEDRIHYTLSVAAEDLGRVIGKDGRNAKAMRTLLTAASALRGHRAVLEIANEPSTGGEAGDQPKPEEPGEPEEPGDAEEA
jgi:predicted RNA-binding protein YlqC (UPF0109 family)